MKLFLRLIFLGMSGWTLQVDASDDREELDRFRAVAFTTVRSASVAKILDPAKHELAEKPKTLFHGFALISPWRTVDPDTRLQLTGILRTPIAHWIKVYESPQPGDVAKLSTFCLPDPGFAIHLETDRGPRDFVLCLECDQIVAYGSSGQGAKFSVEDEPLGQLRQDYRKEFHE